MCLTLKKPIIQLMSVECFVVQLQCMQLFHAADQAISSRWSSDHKRLINYLLKAIFSTPFAAFEELMHSLSTNDVTVTIFEVRTFF